MRRAGPGCALPCALQEGDWRELLRMYMKMLVAADPREYAVESKLCARALRALIVRAPVDVAGQQDALVRFYRQYLHGGAGGGPPAGVAVDAALEALVHVMLAHGRDMRAALLALHAAIHKAIPAMWAMRRPALRHVVVQYFRAMLALCAPRVGPQSAMDGISDVARMVAAELDDLARTHGAAGMAGHPLAAVHVDYARHAFLSLAVAIMPHVSTNASATGPATQGTQGTPSKRRRVQSGAYGWAVVHARCAEGSVPWLQLLHHALCIAPAQLLAAPYPWVCECECEAPPVRSLPCPALPWW
jgi:hypothetical protein